MKVWTYSAPTFEGPRKLRRLIYDTRMKSCSINSDFVRVPGNYSHCHAVVEFCLSVCLRAIGVRPQNSIDGKSSGREATEHKAPSARLSEIAHPIFLRTLEDIKSHVRLICALFFPSIRLEPISFASTRVEVSFWCYHLALAISGINGSHAHANQSHTRVAAAAHSVKAKRNWKYAREPSHDLVSISPPFGQESLHESVASTRVKLK